MELPRKAPKIRDAEKRNQHRYADDDLADLGQQLAAASAEVCGSLTREQISAVTAEWRP